ncbi:hypothetical protein FNV43_RR24092 [Rhamnella rubrinervis]|uniref:Uncharacterized protein n=1 Tax=Rhamnella rubrinervis TaxID=2594499 RepID=A0A8K0DSD4_9ROSA|nr:hypothetical protein FNV43_RR24092 [Rhamnella rubrinervis]
MTVVSGLGLSHKITGHVDKLLLGGPVYIESSILFDSETYERLLLGASLRYLNLSRAGFGGMVPPQLGNLTDLHYLNLDNCYCDTNLYAKNLQWLSHHSWLRYIEMSCVDLGQASDWLQGGFSWSKFKYAPWFSRLEFLDLSFNELGGKISSEITNLTNIVTLYLSSNQLEGKLPTSMGTQLCRLKKIDLSFNFKESSQEISQVLDTFSGCASETLEVLNVTYVLWLLRYTGPCNLSGPMPKCFNKFSAMASVKPDSGFPDIANGGLSYTIPGNISVSFKEDALLVVKGKAVEYEENLPLVRSLDLSREIPGMIGGMEALESIDFSMNQLWGEIPTSMSTMSSLSHLNLSYNKLIGKIPTGTQLQSFDASILPKKSFDASSFIGNGLCGPPLAKNCSTVAGVENKSSGEEGDNAMSWFYIGMGVGLLGSLWCAFSEQNMEALLFSTCSSHQKSYLCGFRPNSETVP